MRFTSIAIQNTIHYEHSVKDSKTGLYNHNFFSNRVSEQTARSLRNGDPYSVIVLDIDKFKIFNDSHGHLAGDEVIIRLAAILRKTMREGDIVSRFGGEEFTVLLPAAGVSEAYMAAERIRKAVEEMEIDSKGSRLKVTVSLGVATFHPSERPVAGNILKRADKALYRSKKNGRNRTTLFRTGLLYRAEGMDSRTRG
jgi:diguanylate cyclase (GGDEF)-like protein